VNPARAWFGFLTWAAVFWWQDAQSVGVLANSVGLWLLWQLSQATAACRAKRGIWVRSWTFRISSWAAKVLGV
jgi:hypothetical protein